MKTNRLRSVLLLSISAAALSFSSCHDHGIVIHPVEGKNHARIEKNWPAIEAALKGHEELYYIETYRDGELDRAHKPIGKLCDLLLVPKLKDVRSAARQNRFTGHAIQVGVAVDASFDLEVLNPLDDSPRVRSWVVPNMPQAHHPPYVPESNDLVNAVKKSLQDSGEGGGPAH